MITKTIKGFTLIEVLVSAAIMVILGAGFLGMQYIFSQNQVAAWRSYNNIEEANKIIASFIKELRNAKQSETGSHPLQTLSDNEIVFFTDYDWDLDIERIRYTHNSNQLIKGVIEPQGNPVSYPVDSEKVTVLSENVTNPSGAMFLYYNENWPEDTLNNPLPLASRIADTRMVKITLSININPEDIKSEFTLESVVQIRTLQILNL